MALASAVAPGPQRRVRRPGLRLAGSVPAGTPHPAPSLLVRVSVPTAETPRFPVPRVATGRQRASATRALQGCSAGSASLVGAAAVAGHAVGPLAGGADVAAAVRRAALGAGSGRPLRGRLPGGLARAPGGVLASLAARGRGGRRLLTKELRVVARARRREGLVGVGVQLAARPEP